MKGLEHFFYEERLREFSLEKTIIWNYPINVYEYLKGECKKDGQRLFSLVTSDRIRGRSTKSSIQEFPSEHQEMPF